MIVYVRFNQTRTVQRVGGATFEEGCVYAMSSDSAKRWVKRGVAEIVNPPSVATSEEVSSESEESTVTDTEKDAGDVDAVDSATTVEKSNGGSDSVGTEYNAGASRSRSRGGRSSARN